MDTSIEDKVNLYIKNFNILNKNYKWHIQSELIMLIPLLYIVHDKEFNLEEFHKISKYLKEKTGFFSPLHSHQRFTVSAILIAKYANVKEKVDELLIYLDKLMNVGFKKGPYLVTSALALMSTLDKEQNLELRLEKAMDIYKGMKNKHFFLTSQNDYPVAILLSKFDEPVDELIDEIEYYYNNLAEGPFKKGNDLQFLSHILKLSNIENKNFIINRCSDICERLLTQELKIRRLHYPQIGMMTIVDSELDDELEAIKEITDRLNKEKKLKWLKDINLIVAIVLVITDLFKNMNQDINIIEAGVSTTIEAIIEAQNAALIATITSASAVAAVSGN